MGSKSNCSASPRYFDRPIIMETMKVKPWGKDQGDYVVINVNEFDESKHERFIEPPEADKKKGK